MQIQNPTNSQHQWAHPMFHTTAASNKENASSLVQSQLPTKDPNSLLDHKLITKTYHHLRRFGRDLSNLQGTDHNNHGSLEPKQVYTVTGGQENIVNMKAMQPGEAYHPAQHIKSAKSASGGSTQQLKIMRMKSQMGNASGQHRLSFKTSAGEHTQSLEGRQPALQQLLNKFSSAKDNSQQVKVVGGNSQERKSIQFQTNKSARENFQTQQRHIGVN